MPGQKSKVGRASRLMNAAKLAFVLTTSAMSVSVTGCGGLQMASNSWSYNSAWNNFIVKHRNQGMAIKAWHRRKHHFCNEEYMDAFCDGFIAGYLAVADGGGDPCTPSFAPRQYWSWEYQSGEGQRKVASWFAGFPHGARAAEEDGVGNWSQLQTSYGVQNEYCQAGLLGENQHPGMYPMPEREAAGKTFAEQKANQAANPDKPAPEAIPGTPVESTGESQPPIDLTPPAEVGSSGRSSLQPGTSRLVR